MFKLSAVFAFLAISQVAFASPAPLVTENVTDLEGRANLHTYLDFSGARAGQDAIQFLWDRGLYVTEYQMPDPSKGPVPREFLKSNVYFGNGVLNMRVNGYTGGFIKGAEIATLNSAPYGSVRVQYKSSGVPGVCEGNFFYTNDNLEVDFEILTSTTRTSSPYVPAGIWATNQALVPGGQKTYQIVPFTFNPQDAFHEYRIDWTATASTFFIDGRQVARLTSNVPKEAMKYLFNVWSNGDPYWSAGPPTRDSITQIRSIDLYQGYLP